MAVTDEGAVCVCACACVSVCAPICEGMWLPVMRMKDRNAFWKVWWAKGNNKGKKKAEGTGREETRKTRSFCVCYFSLTKVGASRRPGCPTREWRCVVLKSWNPTLRNPSQFLELCSYFSFSSNGTAKTYNLTQMRMQTKNEKHQNLGIAVWNFQRFSTYFKPFHIPSLFLPPNKNILSSI